MTPWRSLDTYSSRCSPFFVHVPPFAQDEIFHIPQAQAYCSGNWSHWDQKITTLPGLYVVTVGAVNAMKSLRSLAPSLIPAVECDTDTLRQINIVFAVTTVVLVFLLLRRLNSAPVSSLWVLLRTAFIAALPTHAFFYSLFYTDAGAACAVLLTYYLSLAADGPDARALAMSVLTGLVAAVAVLFRQTNVVWVGLILALSLLREVPASALTGPLALQPLTVLRALLARPAVILRRLPLLTVLGGFVAFVVANGGIVVGDKDNHIVDRHFAQLGYAALFMLSAVAPATWHELAAAAAPAAVRAPHSASSSAPAPSVAPVAAAGAALTALAALAVHYGTVVHPFLLADNRHLPFYLWRRVWGATPWVRYAFAPVYAVAAIAIDRSMARAQQPETHVLAVAATSPPLSAAAVARSPLGRALFYACTAAALVPSPLVEFRYLTMPWLWVAVHQSPWPATARARTVVLGGLSPLWLDALWTAGAVAVTAAAWGVFLWRPFAWPDGSVARFMW
jgi:alpha-1,2-glucosyltransferase